jgi:hypothetical protein
MKALADSCLKDLKPERIRHFAMIFRGMLICMMMNDNPDATLSVFRQAMEIVQLSESYPEDEISWLAITAFNTSQSLSTYLYYGLT